jgi:hypothetical protein
MGWGLTIVGEVLTIDTTLISDKIQVMPIF